jgi:hypothetical protein
MYWKDALRVVNEWLEEWDIRLKDAKMTNEWLLITVYPPDEKDGVPLNLVTQIKAEGVYLQPKWGYGDYTFGIKLTPEP